MIFLNNFNLFAIRCHFINEKKINIQSDSENIEQT